MNSKETKLGWTNKVYLLLVSNSPFPELKWTQKKRNWDESTKCTHFWCPNHNFQSWNEQTQLGEINNIYSLLMSNLPFLKLKLTQNEEHWDKSTKCTHYWCQNHHFQSWNELKRNEIGINQQSVLTFGVQISISKVELN